MMSSCRLRKRENPQPLDQLVVSLKLPKLPRLQRNASCENEPLDANCSARNTHSRSLGEQLAPILPLEGDSQGTLNRETRKQKEGEGKDWVKKQQPLVQQPLVLVSTSVVKLSSEVIGSIHSVLGVERGCESHDVLVAVSVLHPHLNNQEANAILRSRNSTGRAASPDSDSNGCVFIGSLVCQLEGSLDMGGIFRDGCQNVQLALFLDKSSGGKTKWQLEIEVGRAAWYVPVKMDPLLTELSIDDTEQMLFSTAPLVKLFLPHDSHCGSMQSLPLEFWATSKICNPVSASHCDCKLPRGKRRQEMTRAMCQLVSMLHPCYSLEELWTPPVEGPTALDRSSSIITQVQQFYKSIRGKEATPIDPEATPTLPDIPGLTAELRQYQCQAVAWMLGREGVGGGERSGEDLHVHVLWRKLPVQEPMETYFNPHTIEFSSSFFPAQPLPCGGILADEMGLGKTVEMLALILNHRGTREDSRSSQVSEEAAFHVQIRCMCGDNTESSPGDMGMVQCERCWFWQHMYCSGFSEEHGDVFVCTKCLLEEPFRSRTTLIICPGTILLQWQQEIQKHTEPGTLKVLVYPGVAKRYVSPLEMASCDVVLASYEILRSELFHATSQNFYKKLRYPKRFTSFPSPLPAVHWWRVCLDEAQMVESTTVRAAEMVLMLKTENRWCMTGTPVQKDLMDLYGLLLFLQVDPYHTYQWYQDLLWLPLLKGQDSAIICLFSKLMWRNSKADVAAELQLPLLTSKLHWVNFTSVEEYFYKRQQETCVNNIFNISGSESADRALSTMQQRAVTEFLTPLHSLRQACCTPQIVRTGYLARDGTKKPLSMENLLSKLIQQAKVEARDALRLVVLTLNGLAGIHILGCRHRDAVSLYREAIALWQEYKKQDVDCDRLQRIHALENLAILLKEHPEVAGEEGMDRTGAVGGNGVVAAAVGSSRDEDVCGMSSGEDEFGSDMDSVRGLRGSWGMDSLGGSSDMDITGEESWYVGSSDSLSDSPVCCMDTSDCMGTPQGCVGPPGVGGEWREVLGSGLGPPEVAEERQGVLNGNGGARQEGEDTGAEGAYGIGLEGGGMSTGTAGEEDGKGQGMDSSKESRDVGSSSQEVKDGVEGGGLESPEAESNFTLAGGESGGVESRGMKVRKEGDGEEGAVLPGPQGEGAVPREAGGAVPRDTGGAVPPEAEEKVGVPPNVEEKVGMPPESGGEGVVPPEAVEKVGVPPESGGEGVVPPEAVEKVGVPPEAEEKVGVPPANGGEFGETAEADGESEPLGESEKLMGKAKELRLEYSKKVDTNVQAAVEVLKTHEKTVQKSLRKSQLDIYKFLKKKKERVVAESADAATGVASGDAARLPPPSMSNDDVGTAPSKEGEGLDATPNIDNASEKDPGVLNDKECAGGCGLGTDSTHATPISKEDEGVMDGSHPGSTTCMKDGVAPGVDDGSKDSGDGIPKDTGIGGVDGDHLDEGVGGLEDARLDTGADGDISFGEEAAGVNGIPADVDGVPVGLGTPGVGVACSERVSDGGALDSASGATMEEVSAESTMEGGGIPMEGVSKGEVVMEGVSKGEIVMEGVSEGRVVVEEMSEGGIPMSESEVPMEGVADVDGPSLERDRRGDLDGAPGVEGYVGALEDSTGDGRDLKSSAPESEDADVGGDMVVSVLEEASEDMGVGLLEESGRVSTDTGVGCEGALKEGGCEEGSAAEPEEVVDVEELVTTPPWWEELVIWCEENGVSEELVECVNVEFADDPGLSSLPSGCFSNVEQLECFFFLMVKAVDDFRETALDMLDYLTPTPSNRQIELAGMCHMDPDPSLCSGVICGSCEAEQKIVAYEGRLFSSYSISLSAEEHGEGNRFPSTFECIMKCVVAFCKRNGFPKDLVNGGQHYIGFMEALRKEYTVIRTLWMAIWERLGVHCELQQASTRLRLITSYEMANHINCPQAIYRDTIPYQVRTMMVEKDVYHAKLRKCLGQVVYLKNLEKHQRDGYKEPCPICTAEIGVEWGMFPCGHALCLECADTLINNKCSRSPQVACPLCRERCATSDVNYVRLGNDADCGDETEEAEPVFGAHASKIVSVTQCLLRIQRKEPGAKAIVFSVWHEVLKHISKCLKENKVSHRLIQPNCFQSYLATFRTSADVNVLLMPFQSGSKGLNIVEATHVLLVEPQLDLGTELQAVGRVHRMGQTKPTTVHRFIVRHSIEEGLYNLLHKDQQHTKTSELLLKDSMSHLTCGAIRDLLVGDQCTADSP